jgi:hypothetical protein
MKQITIDGKEPEPIKIECRACYFYSVGGGHCLAGSGIVEGGIDCKKFFTTIGITEHDWLVNNGYGEYLKRQLTHWVWYT